MPAIYLSTIIHAPIEIVFDLSRNISLHEMSMGHTNEKAIEGKCKGLILQGETVTWQARHLCKNRKMKVIITQMQPCHFFEDKMLEGDFKTMQHQHFFETVSSTTVMKDIFHFESPFGVLGAMFNAVFLTRYMKNLLKERNRVIKDFAESDKWKSLLPQ